MSYNPSNPMFTGSNKPFATQGQPDTAKQWFYDSTTGVKRPFLSKEEIISYFDTSVKRRGVTAAIVVDTEGNTFEYWWPDPTNVTNNDLVQKGLTVLPDGIISQGSITIDVNYLATLTSIFTYRINNKEIQTVANSIQLDTPDPSNDRIDAIYGNADGSIGKVTGVAAGTQVAPAIPTGTIRLANVFVYKNDISPPIVEVQPPVEYITNQGADFYGPVNIHGGHDLNLFGRIGTDDSGDVVFYNSAGVETMRLLKQKDGVDKFLVKFNGVGIGYEVLHTGNAYTAIQIDSIVDDIENEILASKLIKSNKFIPVSGGYSVTIPETIGMFILEVERSGTSRWTVGDIADDSLKEVTHDILTGEFIFPTEFFENEFVYALYQGTISESSMTVVIVQNYEDIILNPYWGGNKEITFYVLTDDENMNGKKGAYKYVPNFTPSPAQIAINFND